METMEDPSTINDRWSRPPYKDGYDKHVETLTESQKAFPYLLDEWIQNPRNMKVVVSGGPGTGKTHTVITCLDYVKLEQLRLAPTARVAQKIQGFTIHSAMRLDWGPKSVLAKLVEKLANQTDTEECLKQSALIIHEFNCRYSPEIVVIDEVGMVAFWLIEWIIEHFFQESKPTLCIVMGDPNQLRPVRSIHNIFSVGQPAETKRIDLTESKRFEEEYETIIKQLREFVYNNDEEGLIAFLNKHFPIVETIDADMLKECNRALAYRNSTVDYYNKFYLDQKIPGKKLRFWQRGSPSGVKKCVDVKKDCHIFVTQNGVSTATNGTPLIFIKYNMEMDKLECMDPVKNKIVEVGRNKQGSFPVMVGFAGTIHKFQGDTMDDKSIVINFNGSRDLNLIYTALSRVRCMKQIKAIELGIKEEKMDESVEWGF